MSKEPINKELLALAKQPLTQEILKSLLHYNPDTGIFTYLGRTAGNNYTGKVVVGSKNGRYIQVQIGGKFHLVHRLAFLYMEDYMPEEVDHENLNTRDNRWCNLRAASRQKNQHNKI